MNKEHCEVLLPKAEWITEVYTKRLKSLKRALSLYAREGKKIPREWIAEYNLLCSILNLQKHEQE